MSVLAKDSKYNKQLNKMDVLSGQMGISWELPGKTEKFIILSSQKGEKFPAKWKILDLSWARLFVT